MKGQFARLTVFLFVCVILVLGVTAAAYAVWTTTDGSSTPATTQTGEWDDPSFRYLVLGLTFADGSYREVSYRQKSDDGSDYSAFDAEGADLADVTKVSVVGYQGILPTLKIPPTVVVGSAGETKEFDVTVIAMGTVEQYDGLRIVETLEIPASVTSVEAYSFAFCDSLREVTFVAGGGALSLGDKCFYGCVNLDRSAVDFGEREIAEGEYCFG